VVVAGGGWWRVAAGSGLHTSNACSKFPTLEKAKTKVTARQILHVLRFAVGVLLQSLSLSALLSLKCVCGCV